MVWWWFFGFALASFALWLMHKHVHFLFPLNICDTECCSWIPSIVMWEKWLRVSQTSHHCQGWICSIVNVESLYCPTCITATSTVMWRRVRRSLGRPLSKMMKPLDRHSSMYTVFSSIRLETREMFIYIYIISSSQLSGHQPTRQWQYGRGKVVCIAWSKGRGVHIASWPFTPFLVPS